MVFRWPIVLALLVASSSSSLAHQQQTAQASYVEAFGTHTAIADRLAELIGAEEPLQSADVARLLSAVRRACAAGPASPQYRLEVPDLLRQYGKGEGHVLDRHAIEQACTAIMACQLDDSCSISDSHSHDLTDPGSVPVTNWLRLGAAFALFLEGLAGVYIPVLLTTVDGYEWWLSLLNCFSGGIFLTTGLVHLLPHCAEAQARLGPQLSGLVGDYPLYLVLITIGYMLVLFVERVLFDVHGASHGHGPHTGIAPPCVDCRSAEQPEAGSASSSDDEGRGDEGDAQEAGRQGPAAGSRAANGALDAAQDAAAALTPGRARYNLRSRGGTTSEQLAKPLLPGDEGAAAGADAHGHHQHTPVGHSHGHSHPGHGGHEHSHHHGGHVAPHHHHGSPASGDLTQGLILLVAMVVHTFLECMALGLMDLRKEFLMLFMAIASHKLISGLALSSRFLKEGATTKQITLCVGPFVFVAPAAILCGMFVRDVDPLVSLCLSCFATGTFLYVGASEIVEEEFEGDMRSGRTDISQVFARWVKFGMLLLGLAAIAALSMVPDAHDHGGGSGHDHAPLGGHHHHNHHH